MNQDVFREKTKEVETPIEQTLVFKQLNRIQKELKAPKNQHNTFGNYHYRSCEDILEAVKPLLGDCVITLNDEIVQVGERYYVKATATISDGENTISNIALAREAQDKKGMDDSQITGATSSYARKYALSGLFAIDDTKDADSMDNRKQKQPEHRLENKSINSNKCEYCGAVGNFHKPSCPNNPNKK